MINFYTKLKGKKTHNPQYESHMIELPFRMLICTASGGGKTNFLMNLITLMTGTFTNITIVTKAPEPLYDYLAEKVKKTRVLLYNESGIPDLDSSTPKEPKLLVFDDLVLEKNPKIGEAFIRARKLGYSLVYISQSYFATTKLIRQNVQYVALGKGINLRDLRTILSEYSVDMSLDDLKALYYDLTKEHMSFMLFDFVQNNIRKNIQEIAWQRE